MEVNIYNPREYRGQDASKTSQLSLILLMYYYIDTLLALFLLLLYNNVLKVRVLPRQRSLIDFVLYQRPVMQAYLCY
jgi:hypothetical protein